MNKELIGIILRQKWREYYLEDKFLRKFLKESNAIENIHGHVPITQIEAARSFLNNGDPTIISMEEFVKVNQPNSVLRDKDGLNVKVGGYYPPQGGPNIRIKLEHILKKVKYEHPWMTHRKYENLHPFMDGNGRSGRILWLWQMIHQGKGINPLGFLQTFYYQTLEHKRIK